MGLIPENADILPPSDDRIFKLILASTEGKPALIDLVSALLGKQIVDVVIRNNEIPSDNAEEKAERRWNPNRFGNASKPYRRRKLQN